MSGLSLRSITKASRAVEKEIRSHDRKMRKAGARAINKTNTTMRKRGSDEVRKVVNVKAGAAKKQIKAIRATPAKLRGGLQVAYKPIPVIDYSGVRQTADGVSVQLRKDKSRKVFKSAFIERMPSGHRGVFRRVGRKRLPIKELYGPNVQSVFADRIPVLEKDTVRVLEKNFERERNYELSKK